MKNNVITAILLLPLLSWAQYDIPTLSSVVRVDAFVSMPVLSEDTHLNGDVAGVVCLSETPNVIKAYPWSCFEKKHRIQDVITNERWEYEYDTTENLQRMHCRYTMRGDYFIHDMSKPFRKKNEKVYSDYYQGEKNMTFQNGRLVAYTNYIPEHTNDTILVSFDADGNLKDFYEHDNALTKKAHLAYDSLHRLIFVESFEKHDKYAESSSCHIDAFLYESAGCVAIVRDMPTGIPQGDMRRIHYETTPDGMTKLRITYCDDPHGSDSIDYVRLHGDPQAYLGTFFHKRMARCDEVGAYSGYSNRSKLFYTTGDYTFDSQGRLLTYDLYEKQSKKSSATILYDNQGRISEMRADTGVLLQWHDAVPGNDCIYVQYEYNHQGNVEKISFKQLDESSNVRSYSIAYRYVYDDHGNWIRREIYYNGKKLGVDKREITYSR
ncbi:MAG: hypothetical protein K5890_04120 [Bacteroidales bacterium]|nr:hypothetical protein [Bacteroidales bacterium]